MPNASLSFFHFMSLSLSRWWWGVQVLDVIKYLAPLVKAFAPPAAMGAVHAAASPVVWVAHRSEPQHPYLSAA
jgi:hypothetical protein